MSSFIIPRWEGNTHYVGLKMINFNVKCMNLEVWLKNSNYNIGVKHGCFIFSIFLLFYIDKQEECIYMDKLEECLE